jgi:Cu(I)/Ag(I) efflux system membrane fusion protein
MRLRTVPVERRFPDAKLRLVGKVTYDETRLGYITAWVPGRIDELYVDYTGVSVNKGDHMVKLYSPELYTAQQELIQTIASLKELQQSDLQSLRESAQGTIESAREKLRLWGLTAKQIATIEERGTPEEHVTIYSPSSGLVIHRNAQEGMYVQTGTRILTIADLSHVWVQLDAYESDLEWLRYGQEVLFLTEAYGGREFSGRISFIDPVLDRRTRTVKVRVNVPNEAGLFKPDMFVRATVHARIAAGGKVMDPSLAGKWISPMHPVIVKDGPGPCDVCGMDLVPAEELGYVAEGDAAREAPLVIPVSATLMTGTRAIVYVELADAEEPTYEGREVVLGPRAGDEYIILHGLLEGDLVVAEGNFKIDSALQLQAKPSMMSPGGGQASGGHDHGGHGGGPDKEMKMPGEEMHSSMLSEPARARLQLIERLYSTIAAADEAGDVEEVHEAFSELATTVKETDMALFTDEAHEMWMEIAMRLSNDAFEGREAADAATQKASLKMLAETVAMMRKHLGSSPEDPQAKPLSLSDVAKAKVQEAWSAYNALHAGLAGDDLTKAQSANERLASAAKSLEASGLPEGGQKAWSDLRELISKEGKAIAAASDLDGARTRFEHISVAMEAALRVLGSQSSVHVMHCPMAFDGRGARWLQDAEDLLNPYFGSSMLRCGSTLEVLKPREADRDK